MAEPTTIMVAGQPVRVQLTTLATKSLQLDPENPRIKYTAEVKGITPKGNQQIRDLLLEDDDIRQLLQDIKRDGGVHDPILVNKDGKIIEGNSRAACYMKLREAPGADGRWDAIPAHVLLEQMQPGEVAILQGYYHVRMKNKWATYAKAAHIHQLVTVHKKTPEEVCQALGMQLKTVQSMMRAYETMKRYSFGGSAKKDPEKTVRTFSYVLEYEKRPDLEEFRKSEKDRKQFTQWIKEGKFERGEDVRKLGAVLRNPRTRAAFEKGGMEAAKPLLLKVAPTAEKGQYRLVGRIIKRFKDHFAKEVHLVRESDECAKMLRALVTTVERVLAAAQK